MTSLTWIADAGLALLLMGTLVMAVRLDRALRVVRRDRTAFEALITNLSAATASVRAGIQALRNEADRASEQIERRTEDADKMATDLSFLVEAADRAAARLETVLLATPGSAVREGDEVATQPSPPTSMTEDIARPSPAEAPGRRRKSRRSRPAEPAKNELPPAEPSAAAPAGPTDPVSPSLTELQKLAGITTRHRPAPPALGGAELPRRAVL